MERTTISKAPPIYIATEYTNGALGIGKMRHFLTEGAAVDYLTKELGLKSHYMSRLYHMRSGCIPRLIRPTALDRPRSGIQKRPIQLRKAPRKKA